MTIESIVTDEKPVIEIFSTPPTYTVVQKNNEELIVLGTDISTAKTVKVRNPNKICVVATDPLEGDNPAIHIYYHETYKGINVDDATTLAQRIAMRFPGKEVVVMESTDRRIKGKAVWKSEALLKFAKLLFIDERTEEFPTDALFIPDELAARIVAGDKSCIVKTNELDIPAGGREFVLASDMAYGLISLSESTEIDLTVFNELEKQHRIDSKLRRKLFAKKRKFNLYKISSFTPFDEPRSFFIPDELDHIVEDFEILSKKEKESAVIQTLLFPKTKFKTAAQARKWAKEHGFKSSKVDETDNFFRLRQKNPDKFVRLRTFTLGGGVSATGGPLKKAGVTKAFHPKKKPSKKADHTQCPPGMRRDPKTGECVPVMKKINKFNDGFPMAAPFGEEGGVHAHALRRDGGVTAEDGAHRHLYLIPEGTELPDGTVLDRDLSITTMESGAHWHSIGDGETSEEEAVHKHLLILPDGSTIQTSEDGKHSHEQLVRTTAFDGIHTHSLKLPDGTKIKSMTPEEFVERHPGAGFNSGSIFSASDILLLEKNSSEEVVEEQSEIFKSVTRVFKAEGEERTIFGVVMEPEETDSQGDIASNDEIRKTMELYMEEFRNFKIMHKDKKINAQVAILENYIAPCDFDMGGQSIKKGSWLMKLRIKSDDLWEKVKSGEFTGFSIGGYSKAIIL